MKTKYLIKGLIIFFAFVTFGCEDEESRLFSESDDTGIDFINSLKYEKGLDVFRYRNYYNGGGVGIGDVDNDGLADIYFTSNQNENKLYLNKGSLKFEDITEMAGVAGTKPWSTGVAMADINGDNWLDIYVCNSGDLTGKNRGNELFINNQNGTFTESAEEYGLADNGFSTHAAFFDFDHDGDLDCYLLNNSFRPVSSLPIENIRNQRDKSGGDKFYLNDNNKFVDISDSVGVYGSVIGFGLGITLLDVNQDYYTDIYVSNDFFERDYLYINQHGKYFTEELEDYFDQISVFSMGADAADLNNDGKEEIFVTDMLPDNPERLKQTTSFDSYDLKQLKLSRGFYHQYMKNTLQMNNGDGTFSEVGRMTGVSATDWSWGTLMFDMDNDGRREIYVTNGIYKDVTDQDFIAYFSSEENMQKAKKMDEEIFIEFDKMMPSTPLANYAFKWSDSLKAYKNMATNWGLAEPSFSNGAAYGDLDNDGDLDLVVNNVNQPAMVYQNNADKLVKHNFINIILAGKGKNSRAIGAEVNVYVGDEVLAYHHYPTRGFQSSMDYQISMGLGTNTTIDSLVVNWDSDYLSVLYNVPTNQTLKLSYADAKYVEAYSEHRESWLTKIPLNIHHQESNFVDFDSERLIYHKLSTEGPALAKADLNDDGMEDLFIGGAHGYPSKVYLNRGTDFEAVQSFDDDVLAEDVDASFFDADGDGDMDLYVVSGGNESRHQTHYQDRLYINAGTRGKLFFKKAQLPVRPRSGSCVKPADFDNDGDMDLFIGNRGVPGEYGKYETSYLLENNGQGKYDDVTSKYANQLINIGMVTDASWIDYDSDGDLDIVIVGDWMPITIFENKGNFFQRKFNQEGLLKSEGWWRSVYTTDLNGDGYEDIIAGNLGLNSMFKASENTPLRLYIADFDENGSLDHIYAFKKGDRFYPYHLRGDLTKQLTFVKKKYPGYKEYADKSVDEIFGADALQNAIVLNAYQLGSVVALNNGDGTFTTNRLPMEAQVSPIYASEVKDLNGDGFQELLLLGNFHGTKPEEGVYDANHGLILTYTDGAFKMVPPAESGLKVRGEVRDVEFIKSKEEELLIIGKNNDYVEAYRIQQ